MKRSMRLFAPREHDANDPRQTLRLTLARCASRCALVRTIGRDRLTTPKVQPHRVRWQSGQRRRIAPAGSTFVTAISYSLNVQRLYGSARCLEGTCVIMDVSKDLLLKELLVTPGPMQEKLSKIRSLRDEFVPSEHTVIMDREIDDLVKTGIRASALKAGDNIPEFTLSDTQGTPRSIEVLLQRGSLVISFYRGSWCPYCNIALHALQTALPEIEALGASIVAVSPELPDRQIGTKESNQLSFPILNDVGNRVARLFGIVYELPADLLAVYRMLGHDLTDENGLSGATVHPLPATFLVSPTGKIRLAFIDEDYAKRLSPDDIVVALRSSD